MRVIPHDYLQPDLTLSCHKKIQYSDIFRDLLPLTYSHEGFSGVT